MKFTNVKKSTYGKFIIVEGECSFCKKVGTYEIILTTDATYAKTRSENIGTIFPWNASGVTKHHIELYLLGNMEKLKKMKWFAVGFPKLMLACNDCFRKKENNEN